jgi:hypothetical protein
MMAEQSQFIKLKHGEIKTLKFTYTQDGVALPITSATLTLTVKQNILDAAAALQIDDVDFTKSANVARCSLDTTDLKPDREYLCEICADFGALSLDKSKTFYLQIERAVDGL